MHAIIDLTLVALVVVYIVDVAGFSDMLLKVVSAYKKQKITELKPFTCSLCMVWWCGLAWSLMAGTLSLPIVAYIALLSLLSYPMAQLMTLTRELLLKLIDFCFRWIS